MIVALLLAYSCKESDVNPPKVDPLPKTSEFQGQPLSMTGSGFDQVQFVFLGQVQMSYALDGNTITFTIPVEHPVGMTEITLAMKDGVRVTTPFEVLLKPTPTIAGFNPFVAIGEDQTITGTSLDNNTVVTVDGVAASIVSVSDTQLVFTIPDGIDVSGPIDFKITTDYGSAENKTAFYARQNFLVNSDLSEGTGNDFTGWEKLNGGDRMTEVTGSDAYGGGRSMRIDPASGNPWDNQLAGTPTPLTFGETYTVVMWAKAVEAGAFMRVSVSQYDGAGADYFYGADQEFSTSAFVQYTWTFEVTNDLPTHKVVLDMGMTTFPFIIDHIGLVQGTLGSSEAPNIMVDGNFENGLPGDDTGWTVLNGDITITTSDVYCGSNAVQAVGAAGNPWDTQLASAPIALEFEGTYELSFWAKAAGPDGVLRVSISRYTDGSDPRSDYFYGHDIPIAEDWTQYSYVFDVATDLVDGHNIVFDMGTTAQTFFLDGVTLKEYDPPASMLVDPGFENGLPGDDTGWTVLNGDITVTTAEVHSGTNAVQIVGAAGNPWDSQMASDPIPLVQGNRYTVKFWAKAAGPDGVIRISVSRYTDGSDPRSDYYYGHDITVAEDWTLYTYNFEALTDLPDGHNIVFDMGTTSQTFFIDDVVVYETDFECE